MSALERDMAKYKIDNEKLSKQNIELKRKQRLDGLLIGIVEDLFELAILPSRFINF